MGIRTRWACSLACLALALAQGCSRKPPAANLATALATAGGPGAKAKALVALALAESGETRAEAAYLAGLYACDADAPLAALRAFSWAAPAGPRAFLAARRLREAAGRRPPPPGLLGPGTPAPWLSQEAWERVLLAAAEAYLARGELTAARQVLAPAERLAGANRSRARVLRAKLFPEEALVQKQALLLEAPQVLLAHFGEQGLEEATRQLAPAAWRRLGELWLAAGDWERALAAGQRAGAPEVVAKALLALRRSQQAAAWAARLSARDPQRFLLSAQALRQQAWGARGADRQVLFSRVAQHARQALELARGGERAEAQVLLAEALVERGELAGVAPLLREAAAEKPSRWEWVARRALWHAAKKRQRLELPLEAAGARLGRLAQFWAGYAASLGHDPTPLQRLAQGGHPDLVAQWAARLSGASLRWQLSPDPPAVPPPPPWARLLLRAGRTADVLLAWREELEKSGQKGAAWLALLQLAQLPPLERIPLLLRAEPRLFSGPWDGLPRTLLAEYLPLPYRSELEQASRAAGVPPWFLAALVRQESAFNPQARSPKGALGLAQLLPQTAGLPAASLVDPKTNLEAGARVLRRLLSSFGGAWEPTLAAYNAGESRVRSAWEAAGRREGPFFVEALELPETWDYVHRVMLFAEGYRALYWQ